MTAAINNALSGFAAATNRLNVSANNIANQLSTKSTDKNGNVSDTPYVPQQAVQTSLQSGGVVSSTQPVNPATVSVASTDGSGTTQIPNVDLTTQVVNANIASYDAKANLSVLKVQNETLQQVLNIIS